ncbi:MAG: hypothetical protein SFZ23_08960 [Planctomycetota bacterium]|nr:hypothetical protein [Planctomycetota bacterium]
MRTNHVRAISSMRRRAATALFLGAAATGSANLASSQTIAPEFAGCYSFVNLGTPLGVPANLGGICFDPSDTNAILIGGAANGGAGAVYRVPVTRNASGNIVAFAGPGVNAFSTPNIDGGLTFGPGGVLFFSQYSQNDVGQIKPGSTGPDRIVDLDALGFTSSVGAFAFVPEGFPGEGRFKVAPYNSGIWHDATVTPDGAGTFDIVRNPAVAISIGGGPEGIVFVGAGNPNFSVPSALVSEYSGGRVVAYELNANGDPIVSTRRVLMTGLSGAEGGARDPVTGDFLFSTFGGGNRVIVVNGFNLDCRANFNFDCAIDFFDYLDFVEAFAADQPEGDFDGSGVVDFFDYLEFVQEFSDCGS